MRAKPIKLLNGSWSQLEQKSENQNRAKLVWHLSETCITLFFKKLIHKTYCSMFILFILFEAILRCYVQYGFRPTVGRNSDEIRPELVGLVSNSRRSTLVDPTPGPQSDKSRTVRKWVRRWGESCLKIARITSNSWTKVGRNLHGICLIFVRQLDESRTKLIKVVHGSLS